MASSSASGMSATLSNRSTSTSTGYNEPNQTEVDVRAAHGSPSLASFPSSSRHFSANDTYAIEQELISPASRLSRLSTAVPSTSTSARHHTNVAISASQNKHNNIYTGQDVHNFVNTSASLTSSTATRTSGHLPSPLETHVSSFSQPLPQHVLNHPIRRPRTSNQVFQSSTDLAAHYGIPQILPPAPRTTSRYLQSAPKQPSPVADFQTLSANYLNMLNQKPTDNTMAAHSTTMSGSSISPSELEAPVISSVDFDEEIVQNLAGFLASPEFQTFNSFLTSPSATPLMGDFDSPYETPYNDFLNTPLFEDDDNMLTSPYQEDMPLFAGMDEYSYSDKVAESAKPVDVNLDSLYVLSPEDPALESFDGQLYSAPRHPSATPSGTKTNALSGRRRSTATGIRKGITPDSLLDETAPTQPRKYSTPSATSRKEVPAVFARKRSRSTAFGDEEDELPAEELPPNPTEKELIELKRRQNTVAARRSRKRKLEQFQEMERSRDEERRLKDVWKERANVLSRMLQDTGHLVPSFPPDNYAED
ncbi:hypothetical protein B0H34DRAFT_431289 [Crassisporium funariophilum]|nr:hypothetical protein B0H34DRAFT_431289 [Crassisporium funariophilum]